MNILTTTLNPFTKYLWVGVAGAVVAGLTFSHDYVYRKGKHNEKLVHAAAVAAANEDARRLERARQSRADQAAAIAASREAGIRAAADRARSERDSLRDDLSAALDWASQSHSSAQQVASRAAAVVEACSRALVGVAEYADRADGEARQLRQAWPE